MSPRSTTALADCISTLEAAHALGYSLQHTRLLIRKGKLKAEKMGRDWLVLNESIAEYQSALAFQTAEVKPVESETIVNVASVPMRSPFRYPGGKTWLVPRIRRWLGNANTPVGELVEPFAGGAIVSLTAIFENLAERVTLVEIDPDIASVWETILNGGAPWLGERILSFKMSRKNVDAALDQADKSCRNRAFATILRNRISRGGILAPGAGIVKDGENGRGLLSRWYPQTLRRRILDIAAVRDRITFTREDGIGVMRKKARARNVAFFIDPPYTVAGRRLYAFPDIDHRELFNVTASVLGDFLMTYDDSPDIEELSDERDFVMARVPMKNTHHQKKTELLIGRNLAWLRH